MELRSTGSGGFLLNAAKQGLLQKWEAKGIQYIHFIGMRDMLSRIGDPLTLGVLIDRNLNFIVDVIKKRGESSNLKDPEVLISRDSKPNIFYPQEIDDCVLSSFDDDSTKYHIINPSFFIRFSRLKEILKSTPYDLLMFKILKVDHIEELEQQYELIDQMGVIEKKEKAMRFNLSVFNLINFGSKDYLLSIKNENELLMLKNEDLQDKKCSKLIERIDNVLYKNARSFCKFILKTDPGKN